MNSDELNVGDLIELIDATTMEKIFDDLNLNIDEIDNIAHALFGDETMHFQPGEVFLITKCTTRWMSINLLLFQNCQTYQWVGNVGTWKKYWKIS